MNFSEYKESIKLSFVNIAKETGIPRSTLQRISYDKDPCIKLSTAKILVEWSNKAITYEDLASS